MQARVTVEKTPKRAGATPLFRLSAAQKVRGVAPALSRILRDPFCRVHTSEQQSSHVQFIKTHMQERENRMAILNAPPQQQKNVSLQLRVSEQVKARLGQYVEFLNCSESYVVSEALKLIFDRDREFKQWAERRRTNGPEAQDEQAAMKESEDTDAAEPKARPKQTATHDLLH